MSLIVPVPVLLLAVLATLESVVVLVAPPGSSVKRITAALNALSSPVADMRTGAEV